LELWDEEYEETKDTNTKARIMGMTTQMTTFEFYYGASLSHLLLCHTGNLSRTLQHKHIISAVMGQQVAKIVDTTLQGLRDDSSFHSLLEFSERKILFFKHWSSKVTLAEERPAWYEYGHASAEFTSEPKTITNEYTMKQ